MDNYNIKISAETLSIDKCYEFVLNPLNGGNCLFIGTVREINKNATVKLLDFETYDEMAIKELSKIAVDCLQLKNASKIAIHHRKGEVGIKEIAVIIAVSAVHRKAAFIACEYAIDQLKKTVPIWKKEILTDDSYWVNSTP